MMPKKISISISSLSKSPKREGKHESDIIPRVAQFFEDRGYLTRQHVCINLAWGRVLSEIDLVAIKNEEITIIEVKSKRDKVMRARKQLEKMRALSDYCFIATETPIQGFQFRVDTGILLVKGDNRVLVMREATRLNDPVTKDTLLRLKKECLRDLSEETGISSKMSKNKIANLLLDKIDPLELKKKVTATVFQSG